MKRFAFEHLYDWLNSNDRKPLVLRGARQVGKSTLIKLFAENFKLDLIEVNCEKTKLKSVRDDNFKLENLVEEIEFISNKKIKKTTILFLDEIQADPLAIQFLRYFYEERPEIAVVCAGSLLELTLAQNEISFPVGRVSFYYLGPMTFCEYLCAIDKEELANKILKEEIQEFHHQTLLDEFKKFMFIGGMPKAIFTYSQTKNLRDVSDVHRLSLIHI